MGFGKGRKKEREREREREREAKILDSEFFTSLSKIQAPVTHPLFHLAPLKHSVTRKNRQMSLKSCPKIISLEQLKTWTTLQ